MATKSGGRNEERASARNTSGKANASSNAANPSGGQRTAQGKAQSNPTNAAAGRSGSTSNTGAAASNTGAAASNTGAAASNTGAAASNAGVAASTSRPDQERELRTSREGSSARQSSSGQQQEQQPQRASIGRPLGGSPSAYSSSAGANPFALMRRMMEDMDRIFSDFGFSQPSALGSNLFSTDLWPTRAIGSSTSGAPSSSAAPSRGQQGLQRGGRQNLQQSGLRGLWAPQVEIFERGSNLVIRADLPGLSRDDVDVEIDEDMLIIRGERHSDVEDEQEGYYRTERSYGSFYRAIPLPDGVESKQCNATFKDGVLEVTLPKPQQQVSKARKIDVK